MNDNTSKRIKQLIEQQTVSAAQVLPVLITYQMADLISQSEQEACVTACTCSASCGSNYSQSGTCTCSSTCGSNYSH